MLARLLTAVFAQNLAAQRFEVVVLDNDAQQSAASVLAEFAARFPQRLTSLTLSVSNISLARNAVIAAARGQYLCLIDDDECPQPDWLEQLLRVQQQYAADVVFAPVLPEYQDGVPEWIRRGGYFERARMPSGTRIDDKNARSGNVLLRRAALVPSVDGSGPFDPAYGNSGGEDTMLFRRLLAAGAGMVWCDEAAVSEQVPLERASARWLLQRSFRTGQLFMRTELAMAAQPSRRAAYLVLRALLQAVLGALLALGLLCFRPLRAFHWARIVASQCGKLNHFRGKKPHIYGQV